MDQQERIKKGEITMKYIIELEQIEGTDLYKAKGFNTLVFDKIGIEKLQPYENATLVDEIILKPGDLVHTINGVCIYEFINYVENDPTHINVKNTKNGYYNCLSTNKMVRINSTN